MERLSTDELYWYNLEVGMDRELAFRLQDERIDGKSFVSIAPEVLRACGFKAGDIAIILSFSKRPFEEDKVIQIESGPRTNEEEDDKASENQDQNLSPALSEKRSESDKERERALSRQAQKEEHAQLAKYFTPREFNEFSDYEKDSLYCQLERYLTAVEMEVDKAELCKPKFVRDYEKKKEKEEAKEKKKNALQKAKLKPVLASKGCRETRSTSSKIENQENVPPHPTLNPGSSCSGLSKRLLDQQAVTTPNKSDDSISPSVMQGSSQGRLLKRSLDQPASSHTESDDSTDTSGSSQSSEKDDTPPFDVTQEGHELTGYKLKVSSMDLELPQYDILKILNELYKDGKENLRKAIRALKDSKEMLPRLQRVRIMRAVTLYLFNSVPIGTKVTPDMKEGFAKSFVLSFDTYMLPSNDSRKPWALLFNRNGTGYLANTFRAPEKTLQKKRKTVKKSLPVPPSSEYNNDYVKELAVLMPDRSNKITILDAMANTFPMRNLERKDNKSVFYFMEKYPHFGSFEGEILREEFRRLQPKFSDMCGEFTRLLPEILKLKEKAHIVMDCEDDNLKGSLLISQNLPHDITKRGASSWAKLENVVIIMKPSQDLEEYANSRGNNGEPIQPYLIAIKGVLGKRIARNFLVLDRKLVQLPASTLKALDTLVKSYFVFSVCYPVGWHNTFHFLATCFYKVFEQNRKRPDCVTPSEHELFSKLGGKL